MSKKTIGLYCIKNANTGAIYIGQSFSLRDRINQHKNSFLKGNHPNRRMQEDYNKGHIFNYDILFEVPKTVYDSLSVKTILNNVEAWYILYFNSDISGYNEKIGICDSRESARRRAISPDVAQQLFCKAREKALTPIEEYSLNLIQHIMTDNKWDKELLYHLLSSKATGILQKS